MEYKIKGGLLYTIENGGDWTQVDFFPTPNQGGKITPKYLVIHFTAGASGAKATAQYFQKPSSKTSAHLSLDTDGTWAQSVELDRKAWHAGKSSWAGMTNLNKHTIGIEVVNPGPLTKTASGSYKTWWGKTLDNPNIIEAPHPNNPNGPVYGWVPFTTEQINSLIAIGQELMAEYGMVEAVGHDMISPGRKVDPGPTMDSRVYDMINNARNDGDIDWVWKVHNVTSYLNGRSGPGTKFSVVDKLPKLSKVEVIQRQGVWWFVENETGQEMWVHSKFLFRTSTADD
jgi:N-acetylmuramoyl-L-alanine amidase